MRLRVILEQLEFKAADFRHATPATRVFIMHEIIIDFLFDDRPFMLVFFH
jgi:hypothetical protein